MICPVCQTDNRDGANYCRKCGHEFSLICPRCRAILPGDSAFCDRCGFQIGSRRTREMTPAAIARPAPTPDPFVPPPPLPPQPVQPAVEIPAARAVSPRDTLEQYMPRELMDKLHAARTRGDTVGERRIVTILFCDVKGSTAAAEQLDPEDWTDIMNGAFEFMIKPVYEYEGTVARLMGDSILAFFGAPITHEDDAERAVMAGLGILNGTRPYRAQVAERYGIDFDVRIGINTGLVVVGSVGSDLRMEYTAMGDAINVAARMEQTAMPGTLQIAEATYRLIAPLFNVESLNAIEVKGKSAPVKAYRVHSRSAVRDSQRGIPGLESPLIGRDKELALLRGVLDDATRGVGRIVSLEGEAGLGKSRLLRTVSANWESLSNGGKWFSASSISYETHRAYSLIQTLIRELMGIPPGAMGAELRDRIINGIGSVDVETRRKRVRVLLPLFGVADTGEVSLEGDAFRQELGDAIRSLCMFRDRPSVISFNDFHWADISSVELIRSLLPMIDDLPLVLIFVLRPERAAPAWQIKAAADSGYHHRYVSIALAPLSDMESAMMISGLLGGASLPAPLVARMVERAGGNPFYIEEVVRSLIDADVVVMEQRIVGDEVSVGWRATRESTEFVIPDNLQSLLNARIDRLEEEARSTLQLASVIGRTFYRRVLAAVDVIGQSLDASLTTLQQLDMIQEAARVPEFEYRFRSPMTQEAVYHTILLKRRREFHLRVGDAMERLFSDRLEELAPRLAHHFAEGHDFKRAHKYACMGGDAAYRLFAHAEAIADYTEALEAAHQYDSSPDDRIYLYERRGRSMELANQFVEAEQNYNEMAAEGAQRGEPALTLRATLANATLYATQTPLEDQRKGLEISKEALEMAQRLGDRAAEAKALWNLMLANEWQSGDQQAAIRYGEASLTISRELNLREQVAFTLLNLGTAYANVGNLQRGLDSTLEARGVWQELGNRTMEGDTYSQSSWMRAAIGTLDAALEDTFEGNRISESIGNHWNQIVTKANQSVIYTLQGDFRQAFFTAQESMRLAKEVNLPQEILGRAYLGYLYGELGDFGRSTAYADEVLRDLATMPPALEAFGVGVLARALVRLGRTNEAATVLQDVRADLKTIDGMMWVNGTSYVASAELLIARQDYPAAADLLRQMVAQLRATNYFLYLGDMLLAQYQVERALNHHDEAAAALAAAYELAQSIGARSVLWQVLAEQRALAVEAGETEKAADLAAQTRRVLDEITAMIDDDDLKASFLNRPIVKAALAPVGQTPPTPNW